MNNFLRIYILLAMLSISPLGIACKQAALNESFPIKSFGNYDTIVIAKIISSKENSKARYGGFLSFSATVQEVIKGNVSEGEVITGKPTKEIPKAVCPVHLAIGSTYLLLLNSQGDSSFSLSRFSFPTDSKHIYYSKYVKEVKAGVNGS